MIQWCYTGNWHAGSYMWHQVENSTMNLHSMTTYGWMIQDRALNIIWDSETNNCKDHQTKGCKCKTGCATNRCSCRWSGNICSVGCECTNCVNIPPCYSSIDWGRTHHWRNDGTCIRPESNTIATQRASVTQRTLWWATVCTAHKRAIRLPLSNPESTSDAEDSMELQKNRILKWWQWFLFF